MRLETRYDNDTLEFVIAIHYPDGRQKSERFSELGRFRARIAALEQEFESEHWTQSGGPLIVPESFPNQRLVPEWAGRISTGHRDNTMATKTYSIGARTFEIRLSGTSAPSHSSWKIESVTETSDGGREMTIPGMDDVVASTEGVAFARACDRVDKWLMSNR